MSVHPLNREAARRRQSGFPAVTFVLVPLALMLGEAYPLSNYPMFSSLPDRAWYIAITDGADRPIAVRKEVGTSVTTLRRIFKTHLEALRRRDPGSPGEERKAAAALRVLGIVRHEWTSRKSPDVPRRLRLWRTVIVHADGRFERRSERLAELVAQ